MAIDAMRLCARLRVVSLSRSHSPVEDVEGVVGVELPQGTDLERVEVVGLHQLPEPFPNRGVEGGQGRRQLGLCLSKVCGVVDSVDGIG